IALSLSHGSHGISPYMSVLCTYSSSRSVRSGLRNEDGDQYRVVSTSLFSRGEKILQHRGKSLGSYVVGLAFQDFIFAVGKDFCQGLSRGEYPIKGCAACDYQGGCSYGGQTLGRQRIVAHDGGIVGERVRQGLLPWPPGCAAGLG